MLPFLCTANTDGAVSMVNDSYYSRPEGSTFRINCSVTKQGVTSWFDPKGNRIDNNLSDRLHVKTQGGVLLLEIRKLNKSDVGRYECRGDQTRIRAMLYVEFSPVLNKERSTPKTIYSSLDDKNEISVTCVFEGYPVPRVRLKTMGVELNNSGISYAAGSVTYKFVVKSENDFGFYTCEATNSRGSASYLIELYMPGPPEPPNNMQVFPNCDQIVVTWDPPVNNGGGKVLGYNIELWREGKTIRSANLSVSSRKKSFVGLKSETQYEVRMNSENIYGDGGWRNLLANTTLACSTQALSCASALSFLLAWAWALPTHMIL